MGKVAAIFVTLTMCVVACLAGQGALVVVEDFDNLALGTIDMQHEIYEWGFPLELWNAQSNRAERHDSNSSTVLGSGGNGNSQCLQLVNRDSDGGVDTVYTCMYLGYSNRITNQGTIYLQYKASDANDCVVGFNDNIPGYPSDINGDSIEEDGYQGTISYCEQGALVRLGADQNFRARADDAYLEVDMGLASDTWYELWIQFDVPNKTTRYYICEAGGTPTVVINPATSSQWWGWRDDTNASVDNIKIMFGGTGDFNYASTVLVDTIAVAQEFTTGEAFWPPCHIICDINRDGVVDIFDFIILRSNYGITTGAKPEMGDVNGDGAVNIYDFLLLRSQYGKNVNCGIVD